MTGRKIASPTFTGSALDMNTLRIFVAVADAGSFVAGGKAMGLTRSAAGKALTRLETYLETRLFQRTTRRLSLTTEGLDFYHRCCRILEDIEEAEAVVRQHHPMPGGILRLTVSEGYGKMVILPFVEQFLQHFPGINLEVSFSDRIVDLTEEGFDLAIRVGNGITSYQYITQVIDRTSPLLFVSPDYLKLRGWPASLADLKDHRRLVYGLGPASAAWTFSAKDRRPETINGNNLIRFDSGDAIRQAAIAGLGVGYLPSFMVKNDISAGRLVQLFPEIQGETVAIHAIYPSRRHLSLRVRTFIEKLKTFLAHQ